MPCRPSHRDSSARDWRNRLAAALLHLTPTALALLASAPLVAPQNVAAAAPVENSKVKAAMVFHFTAFISWPEVAFADSGSPIVLGIINDPELESALREIVRGETVGGRPLSVVRCRTLDDARAAHLVYVSRAEAGHLQAILTGLGERPIVTVGEFGGFAERGGMIELGTRSGGRVGLRINPDAIKARNLSASSKLLRLAEIVSSPQP